MEMTLRWYGTGFDSVTLQQIRQVPGVHGVITTLYDSVPGDAWELAAIQKIKKEVQDAGLKIAGIESVNIHDDIKIGGGDRDKYIENYIKTLECLGQEDIHMVCYNFMPVFDWTRSELARVCEDGSTVLAYNSKAIDGVKPEEMFERLDKNSNGFILPGWEPERMARVKELFQMYKDVDEEKLFNNLVYFLKAIMPVCDKYNIDMAIHPDDPAWPVFGLPRIITSQEGVCRMLKAVDNPHNGLTFCTGSYGTNRKNDLCEFIKAAQGRIHFAHVRNLKFNTAILSELNNISVKNIIELIPKKQSDKSATLFMHRRLQKSLNLYNKLARNEIPKSLHLDLQNNKISSSVNIGIFSFIF